jgi:hypothetical protein
MLHWWGGNMQQLTYALLLSVSLSVGAAQTHGHATEPPGYQPMHAAHAANAARNGPPNGLALSGEMLAGGVALMAGSAYALRRSRR